MNGLLVVFLVVAAYMALLALISFWARRSSRTADSYATGGRAFPAILIGFLFASEFIGSTATVGTAQEAYGVGLSAAWNVASLGVGFVLFSLLLAPKFKALGENTISGALARVYGERVRLATSVIMVCALLIVAVSIYASGGALLAKLLNIDQGWATVVTGVLSVGWVSIGGMKSVVYTNFVHALVKLAGIVLTAIVAVRAAGGAGRIGTALPPEMFSWDNVGWSQIMAWMVAGIGATFATQYVVQAVTTVGNQQKAQRAGFYSALILIPYGIAASVIGLCSAVIHPGINSLQALPAVVVDMNPWLAGIMVSGLAGALFGTIAALTIGTSTLLLKDFYRPYFNRTGDERKDLRFIRGATVIAGLLPIVLALFASDVLTVSFLAKSLRAALAVLVLLMFYAPRFGTRSGAFWSILASLGATLAWFLAGNPFGVDNAYIAVLTPLVIMTVSHLLPHRTDEDAPLDASPTESLAQ